MRPNIVSEAGVPTRISQWWDAVPFLTSAIVIFCGTIYLVCLLVGYDSFYEVCFLPSAVMSRFQVYRIYTSILFHGSLLHVMFNMLALVPMGSELERIMGSVRLLYLTILLATSNAFLHLLIALLVAYNPFHPYDHFMNECSIGYSGILFSMIVVETSLSGVQSRSVLGLFNVPAKWYAWILLIAFQLLMTNVSLLGHLCGILSGFAYSYGLFNFLMPGSSFFSAIDSSSWLKHGLAGGVYNFVTLVQNFSVDMLNNETVRIFYRPHNCMRRPKFIMCAGGNPSGYIPSYLGQNTSSSGLFTGNTWRNMTSWLQQREASTQSTEDSRFPGRGRTLGAGDGQTAPAVNVDSNLQARLLDDSSPHHTNDAAATGTGLSVGRQVAIESPVTTPPQSQGHVATSEQIQKLVSMGFERTQVEVALAAAEGDLTVAVEILMSQQG